MNVTFAPERLAEAQDSEYRYFLPTIGVALVF